MTTLRALRRAFGQALDDLAVSTVTGAAASSVTCAAWVDATAGASTTQLDSAYLYLPPGPAATSGQQVQARIGGFTPSTGTQTVDPPLTNPSVVGQDVEVSHLWPVIGMAGAETDYRVLTNRALGRMARGRRITPAIVAGAASLDLTTWAHWLDRPARLAAVLEPPPTGTVPVPATWRRPRLVPNGGSPLLELDVAFSPAASGVLTLEVIAPLDSWIKPAGGSYGESTTGLVDDDDEADVTETDFLPFALLEAYAVLMHRAPGIPNGAWSQKLAAQRAICMTSRFWDTTAERPQAPAAAPAGVAA